MGYLGRRIGKSADTGNPTADGTGGGLLDLFTNGYFQRQGNIYNAPGILQGLTATGGVISDYSDPGPGAIYRAHIFTSSGTFNVTAPGTFGDTVEYLVVAGGGGAASGGAGAGGFRTNLSGHPLAGSSFPVSTASPYPVQVGAGGVGQLVNGSAASQGTNSVFSTITSTGGGAGARIGDTGQTAGGDGGSGGGGGSWSGGTSNGGYGNTPPTSPPQGNPGGGNGGFTASPYSSGGGGGASGPGGNATSSTVSGNGGSGSPSSITGIATHYAGGGGGGLYGGAGSGGTGGTGGGGSGGNGAAGTPGTVSTGGGAGGAGLGYVGGNGGSGIVVVRYQIAQLTATAKATGGAISYYNDKTIHTFTSSGTFTNPASISNVEIVMVAGGGAGGLNIGGGGGAGAVLEGSSITLPASTYTISVGAGGAGRTSLGPSTPGTASDTTISFPGPYTWTANRGGYGAIYPDVAAQPGGSGGGGVSDRPTGGTSTSTPSSTPLGTLTSYGNAGATSSGNYQGAGGGGAGGAGGAPPTPGLGGTGGDGRRIPATFQNPAVAPSDTTNPETSQRGGGLGTPGPGGGFYIAGGGGGSSYPGPNPLGGPGGFGGGGRGGGGSNNPPTTNAVSAVQNTGGGGGGAGYSPVSPSTSGSGGSGIVLIAYPS